MGTLVRRAAGLDGGLSARGEDEGEWGGADPDQPATGMT